MSPKINDSYYCADRNQKCNNKNYFPENNSFLVKHYSDVESDEWIKLFEQIGSFSGVTDYIKEKNNGLGPSDRTISDKKKKKI